MKLIVQNTLFTPISQFIHRSTSGGLVLFASAFAAIVLANSPFQEAYHHFWEKTFTIGFEGSQLSKSLHHWINDGLMAVFFFVIGLELKREIMAGELSNPKEAVLPIMAGLGGMVLPACIYLLINRGVPEASNGWGIPMATDIAFALGIVYLLGDKVPFSLKIFLTALAIADDIGAVLVIAFFYSSDISLVHLWVGLGLLGVLGLGNYLGVRTSFFYGIIGIGGVWVAFVTSGVHATIAGILSALLIPANVIVSEKKLIQKLNILGDRLEKTPANESSLLTEEQQHIISEIRTYAKMAMTPLQRLEHGLHPFVNFFIIPVFAFANAGVTLDSTAFEGLLSTVTIGTFLGLFVGKIGGILGISYLTIRLGWADLPQGTSWKQLVGASSLAAVGFTMSLFVTELAFENPIYIAQAKMGILVASLMGGLLGYFMLKKAKSSTTS
ncbi:MAG: Na+/H+ antiporter NhaA [Spirosomataceae bacterium]